MDFNQVTNQLPDLEQFVANMAGNEFLIGIVISSVLLSLFYVCRNIPKKIYGFGKRHLTTELEIHNDHYFYTHFMWWYMSRNFHDRARKITITEKIDTENNGGMIWKKTAYNRLAFGPGNGIQIIWYKKRPLLLTKETKEHKTQNVPITITLRKLGRGKQIFKDIIEEVREAYENRDGITVYRVEDGDAREVGMKPYRSMDSIFIPRDDKKELLDNIQWFIDNEEFYTELGIPYRRSVLLEGPPGTGKTSLAHALASHFDKDLYLMNLTSVASDERLLSSMAEVGDNNILVIEDIDTVAATRSRSAGQNNKKPVFEKEDDSYSMGITMGGLLNALDGIQSRNGLITVMTTNHPEKLDPAIMRAGRMDFKMHIGYMKAQERKDIFARFYPEHKAYADAFAEQVGEVAPCDVQEILVRYRQNPDKMIDDLEKGNVRIQR